MGHLENVVSKFNSEVDIDQLFNNAKTKIGQPTQDTEEVVNEDDGVENDKYSTLRNAQAAMRDLEIVTGKIGPDEHVPRKVRETILKIRARINSLISWANGETDRFNDVETPEPKGEKHTFKLNESQQVDNMKRLIKETEKRHGRKK